MNSKVEKIKPLIEFDDELRLHQVGWVVQRAGWCVLFAILVAAAAGLFGDGYLSQVTLTDQNNTIEFERFGRFESSMKVKVNASSDDGKIHITVPQNYLNDVEIEKVIPGPQQQEADKDVYRFTYLFDNPAQITIYLKPKKAGSIRASIGVNSSEFNVSHYIYP